MVNVDSSDPNPMETVKRHHEEMKQLIAQKKYKFVRTFIDQTGTKQYVYRFTLADGSHINTGGSVPFEDVSSWNDLQQKQASKQQQRQDAIDRAIAAGRFRLIDCKLMRIHHCRDVESNQKIMVQCIDLSDGKQMALIKPENREKLPAELKAESKVASTGLARTSSWQDHLQAIREGKRELLDMTSSPLSVYEVTLDDGTKTTYRFGGYLTKKPEKK